MPAPINKKALLACILIISLAVSVRGQSVNLIPIDKATHHITYAATVTVPDKSQTDLIGYAREWAAGVNAEQPAVASGQSAKEKLIFYCTEPFTYKDSGKSKTIALRYTARICVYKGYFEYELTDFLVLHPNAPPVSAELCFSSDSRSQNERAAQFIITWRQSFMEKAAAIVAKLQNTVSNKSIAEPQKQIKKQ